MSNSNRETFDNTLSGAQPPPLLPPRPGDPRPAPPLPSTLQRFRSIENGKAREERLRKLWKSLPAPDAHNDEHTTPSDASPAQEPHDQATERARKMREMYTNELRNRMGRENGDSKPIDWNDFLKYAEEKEAELWKVFHDELDLDRNGNLDAQELAAALAKAGIELHPSTLVEFITYLTSSPHSHAISFTEFRDFLLLMPRRASTSEIYRYYQTRKSLGEDGHGAARVNMEGDVSLSAEDRPIAPSRAPTSLFETKQDARLNEDTSETEVAPETHSSSGHTAMKFLLAGGIAGAVSRTATAPFDRLKVYLITRATDINPLSKDTLLHPERSARAIGHAVSRIYLEGGLSGFWVGNGLNIAKIFPESAIKFFSYETSKRMFARYVDNVEDSRDISGTSRFLSGGIGGLTSQLSIYPVETLKTRLMSETSSTHIMPTARAMWNQGGLRTFYRGLVIGLVGVFPYSAIDMSTFEALKLAYVRSTGIEEPGMLALLAFGSISGSVGATSVYPLNLVRTRLQASGSSGHPQVYTGMWDVTRKTYAKDGVRGFYRGLFPTLAKVIPAVSISYVVYESTKRRLGV